MPDIVRLGPLQIALAFLLVGATVLLSRLHRLGLGRTVLIAGVRTVLQLALVGLVIEWVFRQQAWYTIVGLLMIMTAVAGQAGATRVPRRIPGFLPFFTLMLGATTAVTLIYVTQAIIAVRAWDARYLVPLGGIILGNAMTAGSLAAERMLGEARRQVRDVESYLALGATPLQAMAGPLEGGFRAALMPTINSMMIVGVVKLPGIMTGQMLGGQAPLQASYYQMVVLFMLLFSDGLAALLTLLWIRRRLFTPAAQLRRSWLAG